MDFSAVPECIRPLALTALSLQGNYPLRRLPAWLGELPLEVLSLLGTQVDSLPESFHANTTLRCLVLFYTPLALDDIANEGCWDLENVETVERELLPLSQAQPQIRFQLLTEDAQGYDNDQVRGWDGWWHAECEVDLRQGLAEICG